MTAPIDSFHRNQGDIGPTTRLECKVCWYVYDPVLGDDEWQIPTGVPFYDLPEHWACPLCGATKDQFLVLPDADTASPAHPQT